jgi:quinoprotein glucose dehydrogenase
MHLPPFAALVLGGGCCLAQSNGDWAVYHGSSAQTHYSALAQIDVNNVHALKEAWRFDTGDAFPNSEMECNPLVIGGVLFGTTPKLNVIALDAATGRLLWRFDPWNGAPVRSKMRNRGLNYWNGRVYFAARQWLYALDAQTGKPVPSFGENGRIDLRAGLGRDPETLNVSMTSPGVIYRNLLIVGSIVPEGLPSAPGDIRAYDVRTGKMRWIFHTIPHPRQFGSETWPEEAWKHTGGANAWAGLTLDEKRGMVFAATGSAAFDFYGADRHGDNLFANCLIALDARTGRRLWHYQFVRHDVWDRDLPAPPTLVTVRRDEEDVEALAQITKSGHVWLFDRMTGKPLVPVRRLLVPASEVDGEQLSPVQMLPEKPEPFARQQLTEDLLTRRTPEAHAAVLQRFRTLRSGPQFTPPSFEGTVVFPGFDGGGEWGGAAFDPETRLLYINANEMTWILRLVPRRPPAKRTTASALYASDCASCHRADRRGSPPEFPSLLNLAPRLDEAKVAALIRRGAGRMPAFAHYSAATASALARFLLTSDDPAVSQPAEDPYWLKYTLAGYTRFTDPGGYPAVTPPWGTLNALNVDSLEYAWRRNFGEIPELGLKDPGSENYGGAVVTAGGLLFVAATTADRKFRAFDKRTGRLLWETMLPAAGNATPATYLVRGRQYVVIAAGGGKWGNPSGGSYVAFALPEGQ